MTYEQILKEADKEQVTITDQIDFTGTRLKGLYCDGTIAIDKTMTEKEKACVLAEEMGHYYTTVGNIIDQSSTSNRKQERRARIWAYNYMISLSKIIDAYNAGCQNQYEIAEYLDVTEHFLLDSLQYYKEKYGICAVCGNYLIYFEPLGVLELYK